MLLRLRSMDMKKPQQTFKQEVFELVAQIPRGKVMTYGQIAALCGQPRAARIVGGVAHYGNSSLPWHRVVKKDGSLAEGYPGGVTGHKIALEAEDVPMDLDNKIHNMPKYLWIKPQKGI